MAFIVDKEELKPGLIIFRRGDLDHRNWYCRIKLPKADRYKTYALKTSDISSARAQAFDRDADVRADLRRGYSVFNRPFSQVAEEYAALQDEKAANGEISQKRAELVRSTIKLHLNAYVGTTQIHLIAKDRWEGYPAWRRRTGQGQVARFGSTRPFTEEEAAAEKARVAAIRAKAQAEDERWAKLGHKVKKRREVKERTAWVMVSDASIRTEMSIFRAVISYAVSKRLMPADHLFGELPNLETMRREEFTLAEYRALHTKARGIRRG